MSTGRTVIRPEFACGGEHRGHRRVAGSRAPRPPSPDGRPSTTAVIAAMPEPKASAMPPSSSPTPPRTPGSCRWCPGAGSSCRPGRCGRRPTARSARSAGRAGPRAGRPAATTMVSGCMIGTVSGTQSPRWRAGRARPPSIARWPCSFSTPRRASCVRSYPLEPGDGVDLPVRGDGAGAAAHRPHPQRGQLRHPAALARPTPATTSPSCATSPTSTTRSWPSRPRPASPGGPGPRSTRPRSGSPTRRSAACRRPTSRARPGTCPR